MSELAHRTFTKDEQTKIQTLVKEGIKVKREVDSLNDGLNEAVREIAKQLDIKPKLLSGAIRAGHKEDLQTKKDEVSDVEEIMVIAGIKSA
jgi:hypothetical protein